jgi:glycine/D-amino acid oxidase-like deaminating enzyme
MTMRARGQHAENQHLPRLRDRGRERVIAVIGAGAGGTFAATHLLRRGHGRVVLIDPGGAGLSVASLQLAARFGEQVRLQIIRARVENVIEPLFQKGVRLTLSDGHVMSADAAVLALGDACSNPLVRTLLSSGRARIDELGIGIATDPNGALIDRDGAVSRRCFALQERHGELLGGSAAPEIREQAAELARLLTATSA